jgi:hypothetical protein
MEGIGLGSLVAGQGYIPVLFLHLLLFSAEKRCQWFVNQIWHDYASQLLVLNLVLDNHWFGLGSSGNASSSIIRPILE